MSAIDLYARPSSGFAAKLTQTQDLLADAARQFAPDPASGTPTLTLACSLGAEDMVLAHLAGTLALPLDIFVLDTGVLHGPTLALLERLQTQSPAPVRVLQPDPGAVQAFVAQHGADAMYRSVDLRRGCCQVRKLEPLERALAGRAAWITGLRREQSDSRAEVPLVDHSDATRVKFNPLSLWTWGDVWHFVQSRGIDYNPLHDAFYPSIGCEPCTRATAVGEDFRAGRWWWEQDRQKECGLHVTPTH
jgi:phosphoadenosine phosphosulfate reductase